MSSPGGKKPWPLRFAKFYIVNKIRLGAKNVIDVDDYSNAELLKTAEWLWWSQDYTFAGRVMDELARRIAEEHPPDGERLETSFEESTEEAEAATAAEKAETTEAAPFEERKFYCYCEGEAINYMCDCHIARRGEG